MSSEYGKLSNLREFIGKVIYPPGTILEVSHDVNPGDLYGGEWVPIEGRFLMGAGSTEDKEFKVGDTGGSIDAVIPEHQHQWTHTHTLANVGNHQHYYGTTTTVDRGAAHRTYSYTAGYETYTSYGKSGEHYHTLSEVKVEEKTSDNWPSKEGANLPAFELVYIWERIK